MSHQNILPAEHQDLSRIILDREAEISLLQRTFAEIGSELDLDTVFSIVAERARTLIQAETVLLPLLDSDLKNYTYRAGSGKNVEEIVGESLPLDFGICGWVWRHKKTWWHGVLNELSEEERNLWEKEASNIILVPLVGKRHFLGGIAGINKITKMDFDRRDLDLLSMFASIVSIAIENAMTVKKLERANQELERYQNKLEHLNKQLSVSSRELEYLTLYDQLTGLPNRSLFKDRLTQNLILSHKYNHKIAVVLIDLDNFKDINETLSHDTGDHILKIIASRISESLQETETLNRLGGDEFVLVLPGYTEEAIMSRAREIHQLIKKPIPVTGGEIILTGSLGISYYPDHGDDSSTLLKHADHAMYLAKYNKTGISLYDPLSDERSFGNLTLLSDIRKALDEEAFELYFQPKLNLHTGKVDSAEALGRWNHSERGFVAPAKFIGVMEENGLITQYTIWAIKHIIRSAQQWTNTVEEFHISVNISMQSLINPVFIQFLKDEIKQLSRGYYLLFEITESLFLSEFDRIDDTLEIIKQLGIAISIDDYGTGYSSLSRLKDLPVNELKIDRTFVTDMLNDPIDEAIVRSTIELGHNLGIIVVAEGVEDELTLEHLRAFKCDKIQGFHFARPMPETDIMEFITQANQYR